MADISNKTFGILLGIALFVSAIGIFSIPRNDFFSLVGFVTTGEGQARVNVTPLLSINLTKMLIDFGNGTVATSAVNCTIASNRIGLNNSNPTKCFPNSEVTGVTGASGGGFAMQNIGNMIINVTVAAKRNGSDPKSFWGARSPYGAYRYRCFGNGTSQISAFTKVINKTINCQTMIPVSPANRFVIDINLTIPKNASGIKNDTLTFTASRACASTC